MNQEISAILFVVQSFLIPARLYSAASCALSGRRKSLKHADSSGIQFPQSVQAELRGGLLVTSLIQRDKLLTFREGNHPLFASVNATKCAYITRSYYQIEKELPRSIRRMSQD
ncbi:hypothetical protein [Anatilimnocola aggregata]|uniref:hypothetical protein n=1 Tax=Anatilimnocola aggregata TaxID=2528021 RepID=UPI0011A235E5|nr:hypothetical protein [Anatilimnocola aggregata]